MRAPNDRDALLIATRRACNDATTMASRGEAERAVIALSRSKALLDQVSQCGMNSPMIEESLSLYRRAAATCARLVERLT